MVKLETIDYKSDLNKLKLISESLSIIENQLNNLKELGLTFNEKLDLQVQIFTIKLNLNIFYNI